jgi:very-short-patch-repair endonuclease
MREPSSRDARDPDVVRATAGLAAYLRELVLSARRPILDCARYETQVWLADLPDGMERPSATADGVLLALDHVPPVAPPALPGVLKGWVDPGASLDPTGPDPPLAEEGPGEVWANDERGHTALVPGTVRRQEAADVLRAYTTWLLHWRRWAEEERTARPRRELYDQLAPIARRLAQQEDAFELVLGVGLVAWETPESDRVFRHLITTRVGIVIDRDTARLTVGLTPEAPARLEDRDFLDEHDGYVRERIIPVQEQLAADAPHPLSEEMGTLLGRWQSLGMDRPVRYEPAWERPATIEGTPQLVFAPALLLRERDRNAWVEYYEQIAASLAGPDAAAPLGLAQLLFPLEEHERLTWTTRRSSTTDRLLGEEPLFPLETNPEQRAVLDRLQLDTAVVVQGPPGTGKTHTIANLISALLAIGQRVLVTSQKDQALRVLRDKLPEPVRDLCLLLTDVRRGGSDELERSVSNLSDRTVTSNVEQIRRKIERLEQRRNELRGQCAQVTEDLRKLREAETYQHRDGEVAAGYEGALADIVEAVMATRPRHGWMPSIPEQTPAAPPLSVAEALQLRSLLATATAIRMARRHQRLPSAQDLPSVENVAAAVASIKRADQQMEDHADPLVHTLGQVDPQTFAAIEEQLEKAATALHQLGLPARATDWDPADWRSRALTDQLARRNRGLWNHLAASTEQARNYAEASITRQGLHQVQIPDLPPAQLPRALTEAQKAWVDLEGGSKLLRWLPSQARRAAAWLFTSCTVDGHPPQTASDVRTIVERLKAETAVAEAEHEWAQIGATNAPGALAVRLSRLADRVADLKHVAAYGAARDAVDTLLVQQGVRIPVSTAHTWDALSRSVATARSQIAAVRAATTVDAMGQRLDQMSTDSEPIPELVAARQALRDRDADAYEKAVEALRGAHQQQDEQQTCDSLLERLRVVHPLLAGALTDTATDQQWQDRLTELPAAWAWARARTYCEQQRSPGRDQRLQGDLDEIEWRLRQVTAQLAAENAWLHCLTRMKQEQRQALQAYKANIGALGKGMGRYASRYRRAAREAMSIAQDAVPAWVMPLPQVAETIPAQPDSFDVIIVDEASQVGIDALFLLWLAPRVIIVGDDKQCAPGTTRREEWQKIFDRLDNYLPDVPAAFRSGFEPQSNLYELLSARFPQVIRLTEHFRCMPEIIGWSSKQFYDDRLIPLRQFGTDRLDPLQVVFVEGAYTEGRDTNVRNPIEAKHIVEKLHELLDDPAYGGKTIGIIALQGSGQVRLIETMIVESIDPAIREQRDLQVGTPPQFQGDQRDVVLLSMVVTSPGRALGLREERRRFNVAASRARDQMWLFTSVRPDQLKSNDLRRSLLTYVQNPPAWQRPVPEFANLQENLRQQPFESLFEQRVFLRLRRRGYHVIPQYPVNDRRIDLVVVGAGGRLAVECDGRAWHTSPDQVREDLERERELRRLGWKFWRVRESEFCFDPERALQPLWQELDRREIKPGMVPNDTGQGSASDWSPIDLPDDEDELQPGTSLE